MPKRDVRKPGQERQLQKFRKDVERVRKSAAASQLAQLRAAGRGFKGVKSSGVTRDSANGYVLVGPGTRTLMRPTPRYRMEIVWSDEDQAYVVTVPDLPGCMTHGATYAEAAARGENAIAMWLRAARHWGTPIPLPGAASEG